MNERVVWPRESLNNREQSIMWYIVEKALDISINGDLIPGKYVSVQASRCSWSRFSFAVREAHILRDLGEQALCPRLHNPVDQSLRDNVGKACYGESAHAFCSPGFSQTQIGILWHLHLSEGGEEVAPALQSLAYTSRPIRKAALKHIPPDPVNSHGNLDLMGIYHSISLRSLVDPILVGNQIGDESTYFRIHARPHRHHIPTDTEWRSPTAVWRPIRGALQPQTH